MNPRDNEPNKQTNKNMEKNMKIPRKKRKARTTSHYINNHKTTKPDMKAIKQKNSKS